MSTGRLGRLQERAALRVCGIMSGTSLDGIDVAIVHITGSGTDTRVVVEAFETIPYEPVVRAELLELQQSPGLGTLTRANYALGILIARAVRSVCASNGFALDRIDLIGSHGQTIHHAPSYDRVLGIDAHGTMQIGDPSVIAQQTGVVTIGDFRIADCAAGGHGAPLIPAVDYLLFRSDTATRVMLNIGGIANVTVLPRGCGRDDVSGFDTGPGNMIIDALCARFYGEAFDRDGVHAATGTVSAPLLSFMLDHAYLTKQPPKSTGREEFGRVYVDALIGAQPISHDDLIATATAFTAHSIVRACEAFIVPRTPIDEMIVSGGGAHNRVLMRMIAELMPAVRLRTTDDLGIAADAKEAVGFAVLANETIHELPANIPAVTGASGPVVLGKICL